MGTGAVCIGGGSKYSTASQREDPGQEEMLLFLFDGDRLCFTQFFTGMATVTLILVDRCCFVVD